MVAAGPNTSTSCTACAPPVSSSLSKVGATNADLFLSMPSSVGASAPPQTIAASDAKRRMPSNAAACWPRVTSGPMRVFACRGSPTLVPLSFSASASATASAFPAGTKMRRIAVHFCPAFTVISRTTSRRKASKATLPGAESGASSAALMLSASMFTGTLLATTLGWPRTRAAVSAEPVKAMRSSLVSAARSSPAPPHRRLSAPSGSTFAAMTSFTMACASSAVAEAGLARIGTPAMSDTAAFSHSPQLGKLKALMWTATPRRGAIKVDGLIVLSLGEPHRLFVEQHARIAQPATESGVIFQRADAAVDVDRRVRLGVAGIGDGDLLIARAVSDQHVGHGADELAALGIAQASQAALPLLAREFERSFKIDALRRNRRQLVAFDRIDQPGLDPLPAQPTTGQIALEILWR